ncbi:hypothetical protein F2Q68_00026800 [Brassica cretica]|uniref:Uncharacterized protein n=1 Tax=Brassica cretica TaxID=69181 RepID=A0A8S9I8X8_BRACR|nr:hypothetical protein F2Q68_00026800 [Brassica cretica]
MRVGLFLCSGPYGPSSLWPVDTALRSNEYDEDYREEHAIEHQSLAMEERVIHHSSKTEEAKSIDGNCSPIDPHSTPTSEGPMRPRRAMDGRVLQISRENIADTPEMANGPDNLFLQQRRDPEYQHRVIDELSATACGLETRYEYQKRTRGRKSIDGPIPPSIDDCLEFGRRAYDQNGQRIFHCKKRDERTSESFWKELQCMSALIYVFQDMQRDTLSPCQSHALTTKKSISWLTTRTDEMKQDIATIQQQQMTRARASKSIDGDSHKSIDSRLALFEERLQSFEDILDKGSIGHLERRMHTVEGTVAVLKNHWTRAEEAIRSFIGDVKKLSCPFSCKKSGWRIVNNINILLFFLWCIVENDGVDGVLVEAAVAVTSGEENDGKDDVPEDKGSESVMEGDKDGGEEEDDNEYRCIVENDGMDDVLVEAAVAVTSGEENDGKDDVPEDKGSESVMEGDKDGRGGGRQRGMKEGIMCRTRNRNYGNDV